jgi:indole-3-glycerol phosphate synthase
MIPILEKIVAHKRLEVLSSEQAISSQQLKDSMHYHRETYSAKSALQTGGIIAEHKRKSPSKKSINLNRPLVDTIDRYVRGGASAISVLTDTQFFGGSLTDLALARASCSLPIIRKDFIISTYQIDEAKAYGADFILLIAAILSPNQIQEV